MLDLEFLCVNPLFDLQFSGVEFQCENPLFDLQISGVEFHVENLLFAIIRPSLTLLKVQPASSPMELLSKG